MWKVCIFIITILYVTETYCKFVGSTLQEQLDRADRNAQCCAKKMRCCSKHLPPINIEVRAIIARCTKPPFLNCLLKRRMKKPVYADNEFSVKTFQGFDEDEPLIQSSVTDCIKKLILTMKIKNEGETNTKIQFIVIDHVFDPVSSQIVRLLNPYVIKIKQEHVSQTYGMKFLDFVNSEAREQVYNKHDGNYTGCCVKAKSATCGTVKYKGKIIPYSQGFCCSCDAKKNLLRQPEAPLIDKVEPSIGLSDPAYLYDAVNCPRIIIQPNEHKKDPQVKRHNIRENDNNREYERVKAFSSESHLDDQVSSNPNYKKLLQHVHNPVSEEEDKYGGNELFHNDKGLIRLNENKNIEMDSINSNNYKIQALNDNYEDQMINDRSVLGKFKERNLRLNTPEHGIFRNEQVKHSGLDNNYKGKKQYKGYTSGKRKISGKYSSGRPVNTNKEYKPSMHKLLLTSEMSILKPKDIIDIEQIADNAFQNAIKAGRKTHKGETKSKKKAKKNFKTSSLKKNTQPKINVENTLRQRYISKRQVQPSGVQKRGGQNCADRYTPPHIDPEKYQESAHCLRFSPVWYGVYKLNKPVVEQEVYIQLYEKYESDTGQTKWKDITDGKKIKLGTFYQYYEDKLPTYSLTYNARSEDNDFCLDFKKLRLLVPEGIKQNEVQLYPEAKGGPNEYLIVSADKIVLSGDQCDVAGVGFEAFARQPNRCSMPRGTCLRHQPRHMWLHDTHLEQRGKKGCFFLKYYGKLSKNPVRKNVSSDQKYLTLNYYGKHISTIDMEINADFNTVLRPESAAIITEVYIDGTSPTEAYLTIKVTNAGLLSSRFLVRIADCPLDLEGKLNDVKSQLMLIAPQNQHIFKLTVDATFKVDIFHCSVEAVNSNNELVALRRIRIQKGDRCICTWHCLCACIGSIEGLKCIPMKLEHYHAAGFQGGLPIPTYVRHLTLIDDAFALIFYIILFILFTLFVLGLTKALIGLCCFPIGTWGLNILLDLPKPMKKYYERSIRNRDVEYDAEGWPIHPDTRERVRNLSKTSEFCTNVLFFYTYPCVVILLLFKRVCCPFYTYEKPKIKKNWFRKRCPKRDCLNKKCQSSNADTNITKDKKVQSKDKSPEKSKDKPSKDAKKKPTIRVSIKERPKEKSASPSTNKSPMEISDNPYYYSSTDDATTYSTSSMGGNKKIGTRTNAAVDSNIDSVAERPRPRST